MSDDISIPRTHLQGAGPGAGTSFTRSYRSRRTGIDPGTKRLLVAAAALGASLLGGMTMWTFGGHRTAGVPTVEADSRPTRVKPDNPGGMLAIGVNEQAAAPGEGAGLAPAAEQPDPQALLAQRRAVAAGEPAAPESPVPAGPSAPAPAAPPSAGPPASPHAAPSCTIGPEAGSRKPQLQRTEQNGRAFWRLRTGGFADIADATEFCKRVRAKGVGCSLATF